MKMQIVGIALALIAALGVAEAKPPIHQAVPASGIAAAPDTRLIEDGHYVNSSGHAVHSPAHTRSGAAPTGASAKCGDGTYSFSEHHRGTCSHHGGVATWL